jgi:arylformamidase
MSSISIDPAFEALYNNSALVPDSKKSIDLWEKKSQEARENSECVLGVSYGDSPRQYIDFFPSVEKNAPVLVFVHGGYWQRMDPSFSSFIAPALCGLGFCVAIVGYDLCPDVRVGDITAQIQNACAYVYDHTGDYGIDSNKIYVAGHSAGGHLTAEMMATDWRSVREDLPNDLVKGGLSISGVFDLVPLINTSINEAVGLNDDLAQKNSPMLKKPVSKGPLILVVGADESQGFHDQSDRLQDAWSENLDKISRIDIASTNHFTIMNEFGNSESMMIKIAASLLD